MNNNSHSDSRRWSGYKSSCCRLWLRDFLWKIWKSEHGLCSSRHKSMCRLQIISLVVRVHCVLLLSCFWPDEKHSCVQRGCSSSDFWGKAYFHMPSPVKRHLQKILLDWLIVFVSIPGLSSFRGCVWNKCPNFWICPGSNYPRIHWATVTSRFSNKVMTPASNETSSAGVLQLTTHRGIQTLVNPRLQLCCDHYISYLAAYTAHRPHHTQYLSLIAGGSTVQFPVADWPKSYEDTLFWNVFSLNCNCWDISQFNFRLAELELKSETVK